MGAPLYLKKTTESICYIFIQALIFCRGYNAMYMQKDTGIK